MDKEKQRNDDRYFKDDLLETLWGKGATNQALLWSKEYLEFFSWDEPQCVFQPLLVYLTAKV